MHRDIKNILVGTKGFNFDKNKNVLSYSVSTGPSVQHKLVSLKPPFPSLWFKMDLQCFESEGYQRNVFGSNSAQILWSDIPRDELNSNEMLIDGFNKEEPFVRSPGDSFCHPHIPYLEMRERSLAASRESVLDRSTSMFQTYKGKKKERSKKEETEKEMNIDRFWT